MSKKLFEFARVNRKNPTKAESLLWNELRNRKLEGLKFKRQYPITSSLIADFYCAEYSLIVEVDGSIHDLPENTEHDIARDNWSREIGKKVLRVTNEEVINNIVEVKKKIIAAAKTTTPDANPSPL